MKFSISAVKKPLQTKTDVLVIFVPEGRTGSGLADAQPLDELIAQLVAEGDFKAKPGSTTLLLQPQAVAARRLLLVGLAAKPELRDWKKAIQAAAGVLKTLPSRQAHLLGVNGLDTLAELVPQVFSEVFYRYDTTRTVDTDDKPALEAVHVCAVGSEAALGHARAALQQSEAVAVGVRLSRELANLPANYCTPTYLAETARRLARHHQLDCKVLGRAEMEKLGMGALLAVAQGSAQPPRFIVLEYRGAERKQAPHVLVGKGVTFDTGGISLKPGADMDEMKFDMSGAAAVLGVFEAVARLKPKINLVGLIAATENMPDGGAVKPGDVVTSLSGQTIEILNTDAEGRLILCDALTYAARYKPQSVVDIATLTGACVIALGKVNSGLFTADDTLANALLDAGRAALDPCWRLPLEAEYAEALKSNFADVANIGGRPAGAITAACFLWRFAKDYRWAHLDIAGTAWNSGANKGATGRPVPLLVRYLLSQQVH
ncbi:leucyl aminopeptidase [Thiomonas sp.]|jgi:leucyl aminopeptidase|uniref:leucyl aminopeptidase n=1 Tax=Thiomonas sp. TaxID=2047785 RepID=UPI002629A3F3|nr:leucyl aminopeptidase [Thiomonas sp.]